MNVCIKQTYTHTYNEKGLFFQKDIEGKSWRVFRKDKFQKSKNILQELTKVSLGAAIPRSMFQIVVVNICSSAEDVHFRNLAPDLHDWGQERWYTLTPSKI